MLQKYLDHEQVQNDEGGQFLTPAYLIDILKRRLLYFLMPFVAVFGIGATAVMFIPAVYQAEGKILVESQQIPNDLVRSTVTALANERINVISQRILTRDNLLAVANKYQLFSGRRSRMTGTDMVDLMRQNTSIKPVEIKNSNSQTSFTVAFTVGFEHSQPITAMRVAAEFMTMILSEDVRVRTNLASETTKFLERETKRLDTELNSVEDKLAQVRREQVKSLAPSQLQLNALRAELLQKAATYSDAHPDMKVIKQKIAALESAGSPKEAEGIDALERQQAALKKNLEATGQKLSAARLGESLERGQQSERLEVIEQPSLPTTPIRPNRPKFLALALAAALMAGGGLVVVLEMLQNTIYQSGALFRVVDSHLVVSLPYISTEAELQRRRTKLVLIVAITAAVFLIAVITALFVLPPIDVMASGVFNLLGL